MSACPFFDLNPHHQPHPGEVWLSTDTAPVEWSVEMLRSTIVKALPGADIIAVSNREPYIHTRTAAGIVVQSPTSGLVAAIEPVMRACGGTWIAHGSGNADAEMVDAADRIMVPPASPNYTLRRVWLSDEEQGGYYDGLANEGLWPFCHNVFLPTFRDGDWAYYRAVNARFAEAVVQEAKSADPIVLVQDYHFALLPKMIRERLPEATIVTFWHIPWPSQETFGIFPWKAEIIEGLACSSVLGFHTQRYCEKFIDTVDRFAESRIDRARGSIVVADHETFVRPYPISIEWPPPALNSGQSVAACRALVRTRFDLPAGVRLGVGIERLDYTKGLLGRLRAIEDFLVRNPEWLGRFVFLQVAAPSRGRIAIYRKLEEDMREMVCEINARFGSDGYQPISLISRRCEPQEVFELFRAADFCMVSSLHEGMNLVAKEFVAARDDGLGVLILSEFTGAAEELSEALIVNPYDTNAIADAISQALEMSEHEQGRRMGLMRGVVRSRNVYRWAGRMLLDAAQCRQRSDYAVAKRGRGAASPAKLR